MSNELPPLRAIVTGFDASGKSVFIEDAAAPARTSPDRPGWRSSQVWATGQLPVPVTDPNRTAELHGVLPLFGGTVLNIIDFPPEPKDPDERERVLKAMKDHVRSTGVEPEPGLRRFPDGPHPRMHETDTIDYSIVLIGEIYAIMEKGEKLLRAGDVLIQRGTNHAWSNRADSFCRVAFVLADAKR